jgi:cellulose synthase/poly-beta-1,6-N-acetylglucosamine synthase-like glycosyltransferase
VVPDYIFPMYLCAMAAYGLAAGLFSAHSRLTRKRRFLAFAVILSYLGAELVLDALFFTVPGAAFRNMALLVRTLTGGLFLALLLLCFFHLPQAQRLVVRFREGRRAVFVFVAVGGASLVLSFLLLLLAVELLPPSPILRTFTLLLLLPALSLELFGVLARPLYARELRSRARPTLQEFHPPVSILIPAYNEAQWIRYAMLAADRAARRYPGTVEIVVGNDGSTDDTLAIAVRTAEELRHSKGVVVNLPHGGKSNALNGALAVATGQIIIRCDGDTMISQKKGFAAMIPHFADPRVGAVQGAIHPRQTRGWTRKLRAMEVAWNHYFLRPATMGTRSAEVVDGLFSAFRRKDLVDIGGWVPWNGEDTEIAIRLQRMGYKIRIEFNALAYEDVPKNYDELRKQRVRWARGILMANGQHYPALLGDTPQLGGLGVFLWFLMFIHSGVRSLVYLFLVALVVVLGVPALLDTAALLLVAMLLRGIPIAFFLVRMRRWDVLPWVPLFPVLSMLKQTFRFEAFGTLGPSAVAEFV